MTNSSSFSASVFREVQPVLKLIVDHPFNLELGKGSLSKERFCFYMQQDSIYLLHFARALALAAGKSTQEGQIAQLLAAAQGALLAERSLHEYYFKEYGITQSVRGNPACIGYTSFVLTAAALGTFGESLAALLPCFWIYREVGNSIASSAVSSNPYAKWIAMYSDKEFSDAVDSFIKLTDTAASEATEAERSSMKEYFMTASHYEYYFWNDAYCMKVMDCTKGR